MFEAMIQFICFSFLLNLHQIPHHQIPHHQIHHLLRLLRLLRLHRRRFPPRDHQVLRDPNRPILVVRARMLPQLLQPPRGSLGYPPQRGSSLLQLHSSGLLRITALHMPMQDHLIFQPNRRCL